MPRSGKESRARLQQAAFELFLERGFDAVTTAEIAERAGLTERTYFRHFTDKREVLFDGENLLAEQLTAALGEIPASVPPLLTLHQAFRAVLPLLNSNRAASGQLARIVMATPALWERAAAKEARLVAMLTAALRARGADEDSAAIAARTGWGILAHAMRCWQANPAVELDAHVERAFRQLRALTAAPPEEGADQESLRQRAGDDGRQPPAP
jgi:AcrR family transcriptional regulator